MDRANMPHQNSTGNSGLAWMLMSLGAVIIITLLLPFPISFVISLIAIISLGVLRAHLALRRIGLGGIKGWNKYYSSFQSSHGQDNVDSFTYKPLTFYCMGCGYPHKKAACPKCGSKAVRAC